MRNGLRLEWVLFCLAARDVTRLPCGLGPIEGADAGSEAGSDDLTARAVKYRPAVGGLVGLFAALVVLAASGLWSDAVAVVLAVCAAALLTGARDEQGFAASVDGLAHAAQRGLGAHREDVLLRMSDGALAAPGALALGLAVGLKIVVLVELAPGMAAVAMVLGMALARMATVHLIGTTLAARREGMRSRLPGVTGEGYRVALAVTLGVAILPVVVLGIGAGIGAMLGAVALAQGFRAVFSRVVGGYTEESLGGAALMAELGAYLGVLMFV